MTLTLLARVLCAVLCSSASVAIAGDLQLQSGPQRAVMIELYTSEGCSSCPPAEAFLNSLANNKQLWHRYIPLAFHVDYWDYLGWRDRFATHANSRRQRTYAQVLRARTVYTPEFFVNGKEWRRGFFGGMPPAATAQVGTLRVALHDNRLAATFAPQRGYTLPLQLHIAVLGMALPSDIRAGENAGRRTTHQFVVLAHTQVTSDKLQWQTSLPAIRKLLQPKRAALVVWVSKTDDPTPLQATGGFLPH
jgi:hypothetical protein